jgi:hypothetical protein
LGGLGDLFEDGTALADGFIGAQDHGHGAEHEHDGAPGGGFGEDVGCAARAEGGLAAGAAEGSSKVCGFAALEQHDDDQDQTIQNEKAGEQPGGEPEAERDYAKTDQ